MPTLSYFNGYTTLPLNSTKHQSLSRNGVSLEYSDCSSDTRPRGVCRRVGLYIASLRASIEPVTAPPL